MSQLPPLAVGVPLLVAALLAVVHPLLTRTVSDLVATVTALATAVMCLLMLVHVGSGLEIYWFGGWHPRGNLAIGIDFAVDPLGAGLASLVSVLMVLALVFSTRHLEVEQPYYHVLMLIFMAGMVGFSLSGDLFNMFVMFEVLSVAAVALVAYKIHERAALEGGLNFAVINTIGAFLFLLGIALIYSRTGALNLAQIGHFLHHSGNDRVVVIAFTLIVAAVLIKAAAVPFHFWLADAYAVALTPVCLLLAGAMSEIGIFGLARVYFAAFQPALGGSAPVLRAIFVGVGLLTALWGAVMAYVQDHLKRLLAFVTISFVGIFLCGVGLLSADGVSGTAVDVLADGFNKALLFACAGIIQHRLARLSQERLHGCGRHLRLTGPLFLAGGLLISSLPPFGPFLGKSMIEDAAIKAGYGFVPALIMLASGICGAAVIRAWARIFRGWGRAHEHAEDTSDEETEAEANEAQDRTPAVMLAPAVLLLIGTVAVGVWFGFADLAAKGGQRFVDFAQYHAGVYGAHVPQAGGSSDAPRFYDYLYCGGATLIALGLAALSLWGARLSRRWNDLTESASALLLPVRRLHSGRIGDYTAAVALGTGVLAALMILTLN
ncbi:MAG TPA: proton-conducting transporter membrane subunit [Solirubrobacteraceae bacterium]|nr:proton-conducting transporter membrane subunit [Solirubrobacteraceae bacterium]